MLRFVVKVALFAFQVGTCEATSCRVLHGVEDPLSLCPHWWTHGSVISVVIDNSAKKVLEPEFVCADADT